MGGLVMKAAEKPRKDRLDTVKLQWMQISLGMYVSACFFFCTWCDCDGEKHSGVGVVLFEVLHDGRHWTHYIGRERGTDG